MKERAYKFETLQLYAGQEEPDNATDTKAVPIYATTSYVFKDSEQAVQRFVLRKRGNIYSRLMNLTSDMPEQRMAALESGAVALATASESAAVDYVIRSIVAYGDHIVSFSTACRGTYNPFTNALADSDITASFVDGSNPKNFEEAIQNSTKAVYLEPPGNPNVDIIDLEAISEIVHRHGIPVIIDDTFAILFLFHPPEHEAGIVIRSATKFIGGHETVIGGVTVDGGRFDWEQNDRFPRLSRSNPSYHGVVFTRAVGDIAYIVEIRITLMHDQGAYLFPFNPFLLLQRLETLSLRIKHHVENAGKVVDLLQKQPKVAAVHHSSLIQRGEKKLYEHYYPKGGVSIFAFEVKGSEEQARTLTESLSVFSLPANVADMKSLVIHPVSTTHSQTSVQELVAVKTTPQTVRLSIGTERTDDIPEDLRQGFAAISAGK